MEHENDPDIDEPYVAPVGNVLGGEGGSEQPGTEQPTLGDTAEGQRAHRILHPSSAMGSFPSMNRPL